MHKLLIIAEHDGEKLNASISRCVTAARQISDVHVTVAVLAADPSAVAAQAAALTGVDAVITVAAAANAHAVAAIWAPQVVALVRGGYSHVWGPSTSFGKDLMPRVAALLDVNQISDLMAVDSAHTFKRPIYAGNAIITVQVAAGSVVVATVRTASFEAAPAGGNAAISAVSVDASLPTHTRFVSIAQAKSDRPDLQTAPKVVSGGRALGSAENFKIIFSLAEKMGAAVGASRAAVDAGYAPNELQVGQTGKIIAPQLYMAVGISGAIQHLTGIKDAKTIVAINKDAEAPIFEVADIGLVADLFDVVPQIEKALAG